MDGGYPDGVHALQIPGNSLAEEHQARQWELNRAAVEQEARDDLYARCILPGETRSAYLEYCAEHGLLSVIDYVAVLERTNSREWQLTVDLWWRVQFDGDAA